jgi:hypothetical protein
MSMQQKTLHALLGGSVICEVSQPGIYRYLHEDGGFEEVTPLIEAMGCKIATTGGKKGHFLAWRDGSPEAATAIRSTAKDMQEECEKLLHCMSFMLEVDDTAGPLSMGDLVRAAAIAEALDGNAAMRDKLGTLAAVMRVNSPTDHGKITDILKKLKDMGYLTLVNRDREEYFVTGKIDRINDILTHFHSHIGALHDEAEADEAQGALF